MKKKIVNGVPMTMKGMSLREKDNLEKLNLLVPMDIPGRHLLMDKLKDLTIQVADVVIKPVNRIPDIIRNIKPFYSVDGYWDSTFIACGTSLQGDATVLWDDYLIDEIIHYNSIVDTAFIKERIKFDEPVVVMVASKSNSLELYYYMP